MMAPWAQQTSRPGWAEAQAQFLRDCRVAGLMQWDGQIGLAEVGQLLRQARTRRWAALAAAEALGRARAAIAALPVAAADAGAAAVLARAAEHAAAVDEPEPSITCPRCRRTSYHPVDIERRYCGACHQFHDDMAEPPIAVEQPAGQRALPRQRRP